ncbi:MAG: hypothetical protein N4J56_001749 [Chroococcidiopsis sp. SAG 2025]|uniref:hypothetical protein n=1 Tax=Chroococcidiopsis sp. SAG 2025 TaxID=171389 RepID=UPI00293727E0|nr:hypothetical protein [Chroococcidiopsis sp. SAG 2025]MDV2992095.1 hypothetical protein [Chroococcidiopsis sp. SAG 2025]
MKVRCLGNYIEPSRRNLVNNFDEMNAGLINADFDEDEARKLYDSKLKSFHAWQRMLDVSGLYVKRYEIIHDLDKTFVIDVYTQDYKSILLERDKKKLLYTTSLMVSWFKLLTIGMDVKKYDEYRTTEEALELCRDEVTHQNVLRMIEEEEKEEERWQSTPLSSRA